MWKNKKHTTLRKKYENHVKYIKKKNNNNYKKLRTIKKHYEQLIKNNKSRNIMKNYEQLLKHMNN